MKTLRKGDHGEDVRMLQVALNASTHDLKLKPDGEFGPATEAAVEDFQAAANLYPDGIVGRRTWSALGVDMVPPRPETPHEWVKVPADKHGGGYDSFRLRDDVGKRYLQVREKVLDAGGIIPSSGGRRRLTAKVSPNRSATSLHYIGRALDLYVYSAMVDPHTDPLVVTRDPERERGWIVYARAPAGADMTLQAFTYAMTEVETSGRFINLTELFAEHGFEGIRARRSFFRSGPNENNGAAEYWHFQDLTGLVRGVTRFGDELLQLYTSAEVNGTPPWDYRDRTYRDGCF